MLVKVWLSIWHVYILGKNVAEHSSLNTIILTYEHKTFSLKSCSYIFSSVILKSPNSLILTSENCFDCAVTNINLWELKLVFPGMALHDFCLNHHKEIAMFSDNQMSIIPWSILVY